ncbi:MAG: undecaprenyl-diphosphatase UppP [Bryobacterales bacterium]|nr:undecaprenyl-diphosphatase UppP [Bryobacteraceae bacterium]MDW8130529.1 undecaprenyl-diphosphatase UppP [Bryobacterales bacterium]
MPLYQAIVLAVVQSLTEFLPISSTAHLALAPWLLGWRDPGLSFDIALHLGTVAALLAYFFRDWLQLIAQAFPGARLQHDPELAANPRLLWMLAVATLPVGVTGYLFKSYAEQSWRSPLLMGTMLVSIGLLMYWADRRSKGRRDLSQLSWADALWIGLAQAIAIVPGVSRSGITITAALLRDLNRPAAARFSFLLSTPALVGAAVKETLDVMAAGGIEPAMRPAFVVGTLASALTGWAVIAFFLRFLRRHTLRIFVYYRLVFGIIVIALALTALR